jgi:ketosteroid isomerase-like protein
MFDARCSMKTMGSYPYRVMMSAAFVALAMSGAAHADSGCDRSCAIAAAQSYLDALVSHDASAVPFAADCIRIENTQVTGTSGPELAQDLETGLRFKVIFALRDEQIMADGDEVFAIYSLDTAKVGDTGKQLATGRVFERFRIVNGQISEIEAIFRTIPGYLPPVAWPDQSSN